MMQAGVILQYIKSHMTRIQNKHNDLKLQVNPNTCNSLMTIDYPNNDITKKPHYTITIGLQELFKTEYMPKNEVSEDNFIICTEKIFHEMRHYEQYSSLFQQKNPEKWISDTARRAFTTRFFPSYYLNNYFNMAIEADAEEFGFKNTVEYFNTHFLDENDKPIFDAKSILYDYYKNEKYWYLPLTPERKSYDDMIAKLHLRKTNLSRQKQDYLPIIYDKSKPNNVRDYALSEYFANDTSMKNYREAFANAENGIERDKILMQTVLHENPKTATMYKCLEKECKAYLKAFKKHKDKTIVIPSTEIYSIMQQDNIDDRIAKAERICRNISFDDTPYNPNDFHM